MSQKEDIYERARELGIVSGYVNGSQLDTMQKIAEEVGMDHYNGLSNDDTDELQRRLKEYEKKRLENNHNSSEEAPKASQNLVKGGLNKLTGGAWDRASRAPIVGRHIQNAEKKLADNFGNTKLGKRIDNRQKANMVAQNKSQNSENSDNSSSENSVDSNSPTEESKFSQAAIARFKRKMLIRIAIGGIVLFGFYVFFMIIAAIVTGGKSLQSGPFIASATYNTSDFESVTEQGSSLHEEEIAYYEKLQASEENDDGTINFNYVNTVLMQLYYEENYEIDEKFEETGGIDFATMKDLVDEVVTAIKDTNSTDYSINGPIYKAIRDNSEIKDYYSLIVGKKNSNGKIVTMDDIITRAFELAADLDNETSNKSTVITSETKVVVETKKETPTQNQAQNQNQTKTVAISINDYLADSIYANSSTLTADTVKAYTIAYSTNLAAQNNKLSIDSNTASASNDMCSVKLGCSYDTSGTLVSGGNTQSSKNTAFYNGKYYYKKPLESTEITTLTNNINSVFGNVLVNSDGTYPTVDVNKLSDSNKNSDYKTVLNNSFNNSNLKNIGEDSYILDGSYGIDKVKKSVIFYDQNDYSGVYCGKQNTSFAKSGCGATSMAIIASTYENNRKFDPIYMMGEARKKGYCGGGIAGTSPAFFKKQANDMGYKYYAASKYSKKDLNLVLKHLSQEHLVVVHMNAGIFTGGGHYMVLGGVDPITKKVYVYDPYNKVNSSYRKSGSGWYSFNDVIVKEARSFYIIWKG